MATGVPAITATSVSKRYRSARGVEDVTVAVEAGECFGLLGPNGSGKTTLMRLMLGLLRPDAGALRICGHDVSTSRAAALSHVGYLPGELGLIGAQTGRGMLGTLGALHPRPPQLRDELCDLLDLGAADLARPIRQYSRGMKQKLGLVAALQHDPPVAVLDEPTGGLDPLVQARLLEWLGRAARRGTTVLLSSHVIGEVETLCARVAMMGGGRLLQVRDVGDTVLGEARAVRVLFAAPTAPEAYGADADDLVVDQGGALHTFTLSGAPGALLARLAALDPVDVRIAPLPLEDVVRRLYAERGLSA